MPNNPPPKAPGYVDGDKRKGAETRSAEQLARASRKRSAVGNLFAGVRKLVSGK